MNDLVKAFENRKSSKSKFKIQRKISTASSVKTDVPKGLYEQCPNCKETVNVKATIENNFI